MNSDRGGRCLNLLSLNPLRRTLRARDHVTRAIFSNYYVVLLLTRTIFCVFFFLARVFGNVRFILCYLPLSPFNLFGLNLEFEPTTRRELFLTVLN